MNALDCRASLLVWAEMQSEEMAAKKCNRKGVGGMVRRLRRHVDGPDVLGASARVTLQLLEGHCQRCGRCAEKP